MLTAAFLVLTSMDACTAALAAIDQIDPGNGSPTIVQHARGDVLRVCLERYPDLVYPPFPDTEPIEP